MKPGHDVKPRGLLYDAVAPSTHITLLSLIVTLTDKLVVFPSVQHALSPCQVLHPFVSCGSTQCMLLAHAKQAFLVLEADLACTAG